MSVQGPYTAITTSSRSIKESLFVLSTVHRDGRIPPPGAVTLPALGVFQSWAFPPLFRESPRAGTWS